MQLRFELGLLVGDDDMELSLELADSGAWQIGNPPLAAGDFREQAPERYLFGYEQYRFAVASGFLVIQRKSLGEAGGFFGLISKEPVPELDSLGMPEIRLPVLHLYMEIPATATKAIGRIAFTDTPGGNERLEIVTPRKQWGNGSSMDPEMGVDEFFVWCEEEFFLPPTA